MSSSAILSPTLMSILTISPSAIPSPMSGNLNWKVLDAAGAAGAAGAGEAAGAAAGADASAGPEPSSITTMTSPTRATVPS